MNVNSPIICLIFFLAWTILTSSITSGENHPIISGHEYNSLRERQEENPRESNGKEIKKEVLSLPFWRRLTFGIGYEGGLFTTGKDLQHKKAGELETGIFDPIHFTGKLYWINSVEGSVTFLLSNELTISVGGGYMWWPRLKDRNGLYLYLPDNPADPLAGDAFVITSDWSLYGEKLFLRFYPTRRSLFGEILMYLGKAVTQEYLYSDGSNVWPSDTTVQVNRWYKGYGIAFGWRGFCFFNEFLETFIKFYLGSAKEYKNDTPWLWKDKFSIGMSGFVIGMNFKFKTGGVK